MSMDRDGHETTPRPGRGTTARSAGRIREPGRPAEGGFALAVVLIALVGLTALGVGGFLMTNSSYTASQNSRTSLEALYLADTGLERFLAEHQGPVPSSLTYTYANGTAVITTDTLNQTNALQSVWRITSEGRHPLPKGGTARRTVQTIAVLDGLTFKFPSAFSSASGMTKNGNAGRIEGYDNSTAGECPTAGQGDTDGVATPQSDPYTQSGGKTLVPEGSPKDTALYSSQLELLEATGVDWGAMVAGELLQFDYTIPPDSWPDFSSMPADEWPVIYIDNQGGEYTVGPGHSGRGTLVVRGDLKMDGSFNWKGPIMIGGALTTDGFQHVEGGITSGFNVLLGEAVAQSTIGNGSKEILYHSCNNMAAMQHTATFVKDPGTWAETY